jgi:hypothetical protein
MSESIPQELSRFACTAEDRQLVPEVLEPCATTNDPISR